MCVRVFVCVSGVWGGVGDGVWERRCEEARVVWCSSAAQSLSALAAVAG